jgi:type IV pilus assembly protein PilV
VQFVDELLSSALIDAVNRDCYTLPATGTCGSPTARNFTNDLKTRAEAALPSGAITSTYTSANGQITVRFTWTGKESGETRVQEGTTDVRQ